MNKKVNLPFTPKMAKMAKITEFMLSLIINFFLIGVFIEDRSLDRRCFLPRSSRFIYYTYTSCALRFQWIRASSTWELTLKHPLSKKKLTTDILRKYKKPQKTAYLISFVLLPVTDTFLLKLFFFNEILTEITYFITCNQKIIIKYLFYILLHC